MSDEDEDDGGEEEVDVCQAGDENEDALCVTRQPDVVLRNE